jgi:SAM-dependent methyltransferase
LPEQDLNIARVSEFLDGASLEISRKIAPDDPMYGYNPDLYFLAGQQALRAVSLAMLAAGLEEVESVLDFASGHGRVLRAFKAAFPEARLTASDTVVQGIEFCASEFGAEPVVSSPDPSEIELTGPFDVIWSGSLFTHVDQDLWRAFLKLFEETLSFGGVAVFTAYGRYIVEALRDGSQTLDFTPEQIDLVLEAYDETGFGFFADFRPEYNYGDAVASPEWVCRLLDETPGLRLLLHIEEGWLGQDVIAVAKGRRPLPSLRTRSG